MTENNAPIRVVLVDDHHVVRRGVRSFLESFAGIRVVGEAASAEEALERLSGWQADVVVMDLLLPGGMDGIEATRQVVQRFPQARVVVLTAYTDEARAAAALRAGATGYACKNASPEFLLQVVRAAAQGRRMLDPEAAALLQPGEPVLLSPRETEVLRLMARGKTNRQIANELVIGEETVKSHVGNILAKLQIDNRAQAAACALSKGLISIEDLYGAEQME
jgi:NarL family two-component system response regulator LiaR